MFLRSISMFLLVFCFFSPDECGNTSRTRDCDYYDTKTVHFSPTDLIFVEQIKGLVHIFFWYTHSLYALNLRYLVWYSDNSGHFDCLQFLKKIFNDKNMFLQKQFFVTFDWFGCTCILPMPQAKGDPTEYFGKL